MHFRKFPVIPAIVLLTVSSAAAQVKPRLYFSWGYNKEWYATNDIHVSQPSLGNDFMFEKVKGVDKPGWNTGIFNKDLTIPQYNYRLGYRVNEKWDAELNFDHTKYQVPDQTLHLTGTYLGKLSDSTFLRTKDNLTYQLNNGANFFLFNAVRRIPVLNPDSAKFNVRLLVKGGIGFVYPHVENTIMGNKNIPHFQFGGLDAGLEAGLQAAFYKRFYLEYTCKTVYAAYRKLEIYEGTVKQNVACIEMILSAGIWIL